MTKKRISEAQLFAIKQRKLRSLWKKHCPCCGIEMIGSMGKATQYQKLNNLRTRGHIYSKCGGLSPRHWIHICHKCNTDQDRMSIFEWADYLVAQNDFRAESVEHLANELKLYGVF